MGVVGAGKIVEDAHLPVLNTLPGVEVAWISDREPDRCRLIRKMYGNEVISSDRVLEELEGVDACLLAIPLGARRPYLDRCRELGRAVYVEKPFARTLDDHNNTMSGFPVNQIAIGFQRRSYRNVQLLRQLISTRIFGPLRAIRHSEATFSLSSGGAHSFRGFAHSAGGGIAIESAIHHLDIILYVTSANAVQTQHVASIARDGIDYHSVLRTRIITSDQQVIPVETLLSRLESHPRGIEFESRVLAVCNAKQ